jgi:hypothetical protein
LELPEESERVFEEFLEENCLNDFDLSDLTGNGASDASALFGLENFDYASPAHDSEASTSVPCEDVSIEARDRKAMTEAEFQEKKDMLGTPRRRRLVVRQLADFTEPAVNVVNANPPNDTFSDAPPNDTSEMKTENDCNLNVNTCESTDVHFDLARLATPVSGTT